MHELVNRPGITKTKTIKGLTMSREEIDQILLEAEINDEDYSFTSAPEVIYLDESLTTITNLGE